MLRLAERLALSVAASTSKSTVLYDASGSNAVISSELIMISVVSCLTIIGMDNILSSLIVLLLISNNTGGSFTPWTQNVITVSSVYSSLSGL